MNDTPIYIVHLCKFMAFVNNEPYNATAAREYTHDQLLQITTNDVVRYFNMMDYGMVDPGPNDNPDKWRSLIIFYTKKAISHFMPGGRMQWDKLHGTGNPTQSDEVNDMIA